VRPRPYTGYTYTVVYPVHGRNGRVCGPCTRPPMAVYRLYTAVHGPRTWSVRYPITDLYAARTQPCTVDTEVFAARVHGIVCAVYTAVQAVYGPCTPACKGRVHGASSAVYRVHLHGRVPCARPCLRPMYTAAHGRVQTVYTAVHGPRTWSVRDPIMAVYAARTRPCTVNTALYIRCTRPFMRCTDRAHRRPRAVYMVRPRPYTGYSYTVVYPVHHRLYGPCTRPPTAVYRLCTRPCNGHVHGPYVTRSRRCTRPYTAVYGEHGRLYGSCARHCTYCVHGRARGVRTVYTGVQGPCTWCVHGRIQRTPTRSCTLYTTVFTARIHGRPRPCTDCVHGHARATYMVCP